MKLVFDVLTKAQDFIHFNQNFRSRIARVTGTFCFHFAAQTARPVARLPKMTVVVLYTVFSSLPRRYPPPQNSSIVLAQFFQNVSIL